MMPTTINHRWKLQSQKGADDWATQVDGANPITQVEYDRYASMPMFKDVPLRVIHEVTTTTVDRTRVEPVDTPVPVP